MKRNGSIIIESGEKCLNTCVFCPGLNPPSSDEYKFQKFIEDSQYFINNKFHTIEISGADPGEYKYIVESILYLKDNGIQEIQLSTHGRTLSNKNITKDLALVGLDHVRIPLYGSIPEIHNKTADIYSNTDISFCQTILGIKNAAENGIKVCGNILINQYNIDDIKNIIDIYLENTNGFMKEIIISIAYISETIENRLNDWFLPIKDIGNRITDILEYSENIPSDINFAIMDIPYCTIGKYDDRFQFTDIPDLGTHIIEKENRSKESDKIPHYRIKKYFTECNQCRLKKDCGGITANEIEKFGTGNLGAIK